MSYEESCREQYRDQQRTDRDLLLSYLKTKTDPVPCADVAKALGWSPSRPGNLARLFPRYFGTWKTGAKSGHMVIDLHPHIKRMVAA